MAIEAIEAETVPSEEEEDGNDGGKVLHPTAPTATDDDDANNAMDISAASDGDDEEDDDEDDGTDDDDDDEKEEAVEEGKPKDDSSLPSSVTAAPRRRTSIAAESLDLTKLTESIKVVPKTDEEAERILQILQQNVLFRHMNKDQLNKVQGAMRLVEKEEADTIIRQGDDGDFFYIVDTGEVDVYIKTPSDENDDGAVVEPEQQLVASYGQGDSFGELAIMYNAPRAASCIARTEVRLWALDRISFKILAMQTAMARRDEYQGFLSEVPLLSSLSDYEKMTIADALEEQSFEDGAVICEEGNAGDKFYIIKSGRAICTSTSSDDSTEKEIGRLEKGQYFGEIALLTEKKRQATVKASGGLTCLSLDRKAFGRCIGPLEAELRRNMESY
jgi:cAMP-dependent protein kinase regulator